MMLSESFLEVFSSHISLKNLLILITLYMQDYVSRMIMPTLNNLGFSPSENESIQDIMLRDKLIEWACLIEEPDCVDWAWMHYNSWINQTDPDKTNP